MCRISRQTIKEKCVYSDYPTDELVDYSILYCWVGVCLCSCIYLTISILPTVNRCCWSSSLIDNHSPNCIACCFNAHHEHTHTHTRRPNHRIVRRLLNLYVQSVQWIGLLNLWNYTPICPPLVFKIGHINVYIVYKMFIWQQWQAMKSIIILRHFQSNAWILSQVFRTYKPRMCDVNYHCWYDHSHGHSHRQVIHII